MRKKIFYKARIVSVIIFVSFIMISSSTYISCVQSKPLNDKFSKINYLDYYNVTIIKCQGLKREKIVKQVSYNESMKIKEEYLKIEKNVDDILLQAEMKNEVLIKYGILSDEDTLSNYINEAEKLGYITKEKSTILKNRLFPSKELQIRSSFIMGLVGIVEGTFYGQTINYLNKFIRGSPLIILAKDGGEILYLPMFPVAVFECNCKIFFYSKIFVGLIQLIPFIDEDGGSIFGISIMTLAI